MSYAPNYTPTTSFSNDESNSASGRSTVRTVSLDAELANVSTSLNAINVNLKAIQRDDGALKDFSIEPFALSETLRVLLSSARVRGDWAQYTEYIVGDVLRNNSSGYLCVVDHTSGPTFGAANFISLSQSGEAIAAAAAAAQDAADAQDAAAAALIAAAEKLPIAGGVSMSGLFSLFGDATNALHPTPMRQVMLLAGTQQMTGPLSLAGNAVNALEAVPKQQLDAQSTGRLIAIRKFTAAESGTSYTKSTGTRAIYIKQCGGGGGGGGSYATGGSQYSLGCSAGAGSYAEGRFDSGFDGAVLTIGSGGVAGTAAGNGGNGGTTSFGSLLSCPGGVGGIASGVVGSGGNWHQLGGAGGSIPTGTALLALPGDTAEPVWTSGSLGFRGRSGASPLGTSIAGNPSTGNGIDATVAANGYGVGGMGAFSGPSDVARVGGKGSDGVIFVYEFA